MWKTRIFALVLILASAGLGFFVYNSEQKQSKPFRLGLDLSGGAYLVYQADVSTIPGPEIDESLDALRDVIERRVNLFGVAEPRVTTETARLGGETEHRLVVELPGVADVDEAIKMIGQTPLLEFKVQNPNFDSESLNDVITLDGASIKDGVLDLGTVLAGREPFIGTPLTGKYLSRASLQFDPTTRAPIIALQFNNEGAVLFEKITAENIGKPVAIYLDGAPISTPYVNEAISGGEAVITGSFTPVEAKQLVGRLNSGALPVAIELITTDIIGPTLGTDAVASGIKAGLIGFIAIMAILLLWYRAPGIVSIIALLIYAIIMMVLFKLIPVTLTAAGIAGFIISLGMAVDANILIFERMKEELYSKRPLHEAVRIGFDRAWTSIRDGNISSILSAIVLFWFGTPLIQGFALTFGIGVLVSMITAISVSRVMLYALAGNHNGRIIRFLFSSGFTK